MAKKIKYPLEMENGVMVRTLEELRENFNLEKVIAYYINGKLLDWLNDRYYEGVAAKIENLNDEDESLAETICKIFNVEYSLENEISVDEIEEKNLRLSKLKSYTDDDEIIRNVESVAFDQEELADLMHKRIKTIYLCGEQFYIPLSKSCIKYIGISNPILIINTTGDIDLDEKNIVIENCIIQCENNINLKAIASKGIILKGKIKMIPNSNTNWKVYIKERVIYEDDPVNAFDKILNNPNYTQDNLGNWYAPINSLYKSKKDGSDEKLLVGDDMPVVDFEVVGDVVFFVTGYNTYLSKMNIYRINLDGSNRIDMNVKCSEYGGYSPFRNPNDAKGILCNEKYLLWIEKEKYKAKLYKIKHDGTQIENILTLDYLLFDNARITDKYLFYIHGKSDNLYRIDLETSSNIRIDNNVKNLIINGDSLYYLKWESGGIYGKRGDSLYCFYKTDLNGNNKVLLEHRYPNFVVKRVMYSNDILYYYTKPKIAHSVDEGSPELENKILLNEFI